MYCTSQHPLVSQLMGCSNVVTPLPYVAQSLLVANEEMVVMVGSDIYYFLRKLNSFRFIEPYLVEFMYLFKR